MQCISFASHWNRSRSISNFLICKSKIVAQKDTSPFHYLFKMAPLQIRKPKVMVKCCFTTLHRLGNPGKQGNRDTWDVDPRPQHPQKRRRSWVNAGCWGMQGKVPTRLDRVLGPVSPFPCLAHSMCDITDGNESIKNYLECSADHWATQVLTASDHFEDWEKWVRLSVI